MRKIKFRRISSTFENKEDIILRDFLALERTTLANERTLFSYIRTSLYLTLGGIAILKVKNFETMNWMAYVLFSISLFLIVFGIIRYSILQKKLSKFYDSIKYSRTTKDA